VSFRRSKRAEQDALRLSGNGARGGIEAKCYDIELIHEFSMRMRIDTRKITQSKIVPAVRFRFPQKIASHDAVHTSFRHLSHPTLSSLSRPGLHDTGLSIQRLMSDSRQPALLVLILSWGGNVPSVILR
jgi:hypothetical protein